MTILYLSLGNTIRCNPMNADIAGQSAGSPSKATPQEALGCWFDLVIYQWKKIHSWGHLDIVWGYSYTMLYCYTQHLLKYIDNICSFDISISRGTSTWESSPSKTTVDYWTACSWTRWTLPTPMDFWVPSGYVKIAIENDHRHSGFSHKIMVDLSIAIC